MKEKLVGALIKTGKIVSLERPNKGKNDKSNMLNDIDIAQLLNICLS